jgi:hypothetical protein
VHFITAVRHVCWQPIIFIAKPIDMITRRLSRITGVNIKRLSHPDEPYFSLGNSLIKMKRYPLEDETRCRKQRCSAALMQ